MRSLHLELPDPTYAEAQRAAHAGGFPDVQAYVLDLIEHGAEDHESLYTPERLAIIDRADAEILAGRYRTLEHLDERLAATRAAWEKANPL